MRGHLVTAVSFLVFKTCAQGVFEPPEFNVTKALLDNGVGISGIPHLDQTTRRSLTDNCATFVCTIDRNYPNLRLSLSCYADIEASATL